MIKNLRKKEAFSIFELLLAVCILVIILVGLLLTYVTCFEINEFSQNLTFINNALQAELEVIRETPFDNLDALDATTFSIDGFAAGRAIGFVDIYNSAYPDLKYIRLVACWRQKSGRVIGEDKNLDGTLEVSEDDGDSILESPAELSTLISRID